VNQDVISLINHAQGAYTRCIDNGALEAWPDFFEDYERHVYRHFLGQPWILSQDAEEVRSETSFFVTRIMRDGTTDIYATGRYMDVYRLNSGAPKLRERIVVCDSSRFDTLLALPL
jgi:anthranilate 1,2-dioxygenase small subunit